MAVHIFLRNTPYASDNAGLRVRSRLNIHINININIHINININIKYSLQGTTQGRYLTGGVPPVRFSM